MLLQSHCHKFILVLFLISVLFHFNCLSQSCWIPFKEKGFWGVRDENGQVIFIPEFDSVYLNHPLYQYFDDQIVILQKGKYGIVNLKGKYTIHPTYDMIYVNGGMNPGNNTTELFKTASGFTQIGYNRMSKYVSEIPESFQDYDLYYIILKKNNKYLILNDKFLPLVPDPVDDILINSEIFYEYGILIMEDEGKYAILSRFGKKSTGLIFNSVSFLANEEPYIYNKKSFRIGIDDQIVRLKNNGQVINSETRLVFPVYEYCIKGRQDTHSWIFDYTVNNETIYVSDGESNLYSFSDDNKYEWIREIPDLFRYTPVITDPYLAAGNQIINLNTGDSIMVSIPGKNIRCIHLVNEYFCYIGDLDQQDIPDNTAISGWYDIIESSGPSLSRLICYDLKNKVIKWNRLLPAHSAYELQADKKEHQLILSLTTSQPLSETYVFLINMEDGSEINKQVFIHPQNIFITGNSIFISDQCDPEFDLNCENLYLRVFNRKKSESLTKKMKIDNPDNLYMSNDLIFYLGSNNKLEIRDTKSLKLKKSISLKWLNDYSEDPVKETRMLQYTGNKLYFITANEYLFSVDPFTGEIKSFGFYEGDRHIKITDKEPVFSGNRAILMDEHGDLYVFRLF